MSMTTRMRSGAGRQADLRALCAHEHMPWSHSIIQLNSIHNFVPTSDVREGGGGHFRSQDVTAPGQPDSFKPSFEQRLTADTHIVALGDIRRAVCGHRGQPGRNVLTPRRQHQAPNCSFLDHEAPNTFRDFQLRGRTCEGQGRASSRQRTRRDSYEHNDQQGSAPSARNALQLPYSATAW